MLAVGVTTLALDAQQRVSRYSLTLINRYARQVGVQALSSVWMQHCHMIAICLAASIDALYSALGDWIDMLIRQPYKIIANMPTRCPAASPTNRASLLIPRFLRWLIGYHLCASFRCQIHS